MSKSRKRKLAVKNLFLIKRMVNAAFDKYNEEHNTDYRIRDRRLSCIPYLFDLWNKFETAEDRLIMIIINNRNRRQKNLLKISIRNTIRRDDENKCL